MRQIQFGLVLPSEFPDVRGPASLVVDAHRALELVAGHFDSVWVVDHLQSGEDRRLEGFTTLTYFAALYPGFRFGNSVLCQSFRNPALLEGEHNGSDQDATMTLMASGFAEWSHNPQGGHRAPGGACMRGAGRLARGVPWNEAGGAKNGGCGSVMRAYPFGIVFADDIDKAERWAVDHSKMTHRDPIALAACAAMAVGVGLTITGAQLTTEAAARHDSVTAAMMQRALDDATTGVEPEVTLARLEGWAAHEAIAAGLYVAARHTSDPRGAILEGANTPGDSDSIATIAGALVGARAGLERIPVEWLRDVERSDELLALAKDAAGFVPAIGK